MNVLVPLLGGACLLWLGARFYGRLLERRLGVDPARPTPAVERDDGRDYVPTRVPVLFAHHFSAIAGAGPILGPTIALLYGVGPGWLWIVLGGIFFGAVHDFATLFASVRQGGRSIAEVARSSLGNTGFSLFILFALVLILLVTSAFLAATAVSLTSMWPAQSLGLDPADSWMRVVERDGRPLAVIGGIASMSVVIITLMSPVLGYLIYRRGLGTVPAYALAALICAVSVAAGVVWPITLDPKTWMILISVYVLLAAGVPVWLILQPRDFINVQILYVGIAGLMGGLLVAGLGGLTIQAPLADLASAGQSPALGPLWPVLFTTIACGAISGFHSMVASGTTAKQVSSERHLKRIGYDGMLLESLLALAVLVLVGATLSSADYAAMVHPTDPAVKSNPILAFSLASGRLLETAFGIPVAGGTVFGILLVEGFVVTTLDAAVRINRYLFEELWGILFRGRVPALMRHYWFNSGLSAVLMLLLAWTNAFNLIWPVFGSANQLIGALALIAVSAWLVGQGRRPWYTVVPAAAMLVTTIATLLILIPRYLDGGQWALLIADVALIALALALVGVAASRLRGLLGRAASAEVAAAPAGGPPAPAP
ncbi:MAG: carbon starvation protein A [Deltaproteobacteria bacterium]|nr:carbon starvation protein A [Deltaproteobacteria bacterium]